MNKRVSVHFEVESWDEKPYKKFGDGCKLTHARVKKSFIGDLKGEGKLEYLMAYVEDGSASFVGMEYIYGTLGGQTGSFVLQHNGTFVGGIARATTIVVHGSGTHELRGLQGEGSYEVGHEPPHAMTFNYNIN